MMTTFVTILAGLTITFGMIIGFYDGVTSEETEREAQTEDAAFLAVPTGTPGQSAPPGAVAVCAEKQEKEECSFELGRKTLNGICTPSADELACTPVMPE